MSKTNRGNKGPGYEYWSKRNYKDMIRPGKTSKKITVRAERRKNKEKLK